MHAASQKNIRAGDMHASLIKDYLLHRELVPIRKNTRLSRYARMPLVLFQDDFIPVVGRAIVSKKMV